MSSKELKRFVFTVSSAANVVKKQKRREEKDTKKKLEKEKKEAEEEREKMKKAEEKRKKKELKKRKEKEQREKDERKERKRLRKLKKEEKKLLKKEAAKLETEKVKSFDSSINKEALQLLAQRELNPSKKETLKLETVPVVINRESIPTPVTTPAPPTDDNKNASTCRKPVGIRKPGSNRQINPIYTRPVTPSPANSDFIIPGVNDTEESRILTRTFADKWILPANLYKIETNTGLKYRRGRFSDAERLLAMKLTTKFCQEQNMSLERFKTVFFDDMGTENGHQNRLSNFFVDVSQHFGGRPVVAVYDFLKRLYHPGNHRGPWTPEEDEILLREYQKHGPKWALIGKELNRLGINCRDRYNIRWKHVGTVVNGPWTLEEDAKLTSAVKESLEASGVISWLWISEERIKTRTPLQCLNRWKSLKTKPVIETTNVKKVQMTWGGWKEDDDYLLIHAILISGAISDESIQWKTLQVAGIPRPRHNPEIFFRRWNHLKTRAEITNEMDLKEAVEKVKRYLIRLSKSPAYIFSEDEDAELI